MKPLKTAKLLGSLTLLMSLSLLGASCGNESEKALPSTGLPQRVTTENCGSQVFELGRVIRSAELQNYDAMKLSLESVDYRDVISGADNRVEFAYRVELKLERADHARAKTPVFRTACLEENASPRRRSVRAEKLSRASLPIPGDLHLPSTRITIYDDTRDRAGDDADRLFNRARMSEMNVSKAGYTSFLPNDSKAYRGIQTLNQYLNLLRNRYFYQRVEVREMSYGRIAIYAEKNFSGEHSQLLITLVD